MRRHPWLVVAVLALLGVLALGSFPARAYFDQLSQRDDLARRAAALAATNQQLADKAAHLRTEEAVERLARERYQLVRPGEEAYAILPTAEPDVAEPDAAVAAPEPPESGWWSRMWSKLTSVF